jgi:hypothetical protein
MNCGNCGAKIDYNYLANCPQCGREVQPGNLPKLDPSALKKKRNWIYRLVNVAYVLFSAGAGMVVGSLAIYGCAAFVYIALTSGQAHDSRSCSEGMAVAMLSILVGAFLGTVCGTAYAARHPVNIPR